jgi:anti-anti-sigma factor
MMLTLKIHDLGDNKVLECAGQITSGCADILRIAVLRQPRVRIVVLDLGGVTRVDAAGLGVLVSLRTWAKETGRTIKLMNLTPSVEEVLKLTHLRSVFEVCSVQQMLDLLCRAIDRSHLGAGSEWYRPLSTAIAPE